MSQETFLDYQDIGEKGFTKWCLNHDMAIQHQSYHWGQPQTMATLNQRMDGE